MLYGALERRKVPKKLKLFRKERLWLYSHHVEDSLDKLFGKPKK